jgi:hypothetical protein
MRRIGILVSGVLFSLALLAAGPAVAQSGGAGKKNTERQRQELYDRAQARCKRRRNFMTGIAILLAAILALGAARRRTLAGAICAGAACG